MTRRQLWVEVRARLAVVGIAGLVLAAGWLASGSSVRLGPLAPYDPPTDPAYEMDLYAGNADWTSVRGTVTSHAFADCPNLVLLFDSGHGYVSIGPVPAGGRVTFPARDALTWDGRPYRVSARPRVYLACEPSTSDM